MGPDSVGGSKEAYDRNIKEWKKIMQLLAYKTKVRWEKILNSSIMALDNSFFDLIFKCVCNTSADLNLTFERGNGTLRTKCLEQVSNWLKINIVLGEY
jgi:Sec7-like guanine-nucleotide exchange factor